MFIRKISIVILISLIPAITFAQKKKKQKAEAVTAVKEFAEVCNLYKKTPLHLDVEYTQTATVITSPQDSVSARAEFFLTDNGAYIRFGNTEQLVTDSLMLMVSLDQPVMMVFNNQQDVKTRLNNYMGLQLTDSALQKLEDTYTATYLPGASDNEKIIELKNRAMLAGTEIVKEIITLKFNTLLKQPAEVTYIRRTLIPVGKDDVAGLGPVADKLITVKDNQFLVNERKGVFVYKTIGHDPGIKLPVSMADRIRKNEQGKIVPAGGFENYYVNVE